MTSPQLHLTQTTQLAGGRSGFTGAWQALRDRALHVPLVAKLLGANLLIALAAVIAAAASGQRGVIVFVAAALAISFAFNVLLVRLALAPLDELERTAERVGRGEWYARVTESRVSDQRIDRLRTTLNKLLDVISADHFRFHQLIQRSIAARDIERAAVARQLREETAQQLYAIELQIDLATHSIETKIRIAALHDAGDLASHTLKEVRAIADATYPGLLQELGLSAALAALAARVRNRSALLLSVNTAGAPAHLSPILVRTIFHVAEEAVRNAECHADARSVEIRLSSTATELRLEVIDDGKGFDPAAMELSGQGVGLFQLREMLANVHGQLGIESAHGHGTRVIATARLDQGDTA
jgi:signal transduction histidine kinase